MYTSNTVKTAALGLAAAALAMSGCNSSSTADSEALTITPANAASTIASAVSSTNGVLSDVPVGADTAQAPSVLDILKLSDDLAENSTGTSLVSSPTGIMVNDFCDGGNGNFTNNYNAMTASKTGSITFTGCRFFGVTLDGSLSYNLDWTEPSGAYSYDFAGNISADWNGIVTSIRNLDYSVEGDNASGDYSVNTYNNSVSFSNGRGYNVSLLAPITGNEFTTGPACPTAGSVLVTGAIGTRARGTIDYPKVNIEYDDGSGTFTTVATVSCTDIFPVDRPFLLRNHI